MSHTPEDKSIITRANMVESQLRPNRIYNAGVLEAMLDLPREMFVPEALRGIAYTDEALKIAPGRYLTEPLVTARLFEAAEIGAVDSVLIVAAGTGYAAAIASRLGARVVAVEDNAELLAACAHVARSLELRGIVWYAGALANGCPEHGPYDAILIDGAVAEIPSALTAQLKDKGRLVTVMRGPGAASHIVLMERIGDTLSRRTMFDNTAHTLPGFEPKEAFAFS